MERKEDRKVGLVDDGARMLSMARYTQLQLPGSGEIFVAWEGAVGAKRLGTSARSLQSGIHDRLLRRRFPSLLTVSCIDGLVCGQPGLV